MTDDLKKRLNTMGATGWNPIGYEALERINQLEAERDQLREQVKMLRDALGDFDKAAINSKSIIEFAGQSFKLLTKMRKALAATEPKP